jgi:hypothetical protein
MIFRSLRRAIISLLSKPSSSASLWMRMLMQRSTNKCGEKFTWRRGR